MSAVLKFKPRSADSPIKKRWADVITRPEQAEREEVQQYARDLAARYERRVAQVAAHARRLGEIALELQEKEASRARAKAQRVSPAVEQKFRRLADEWRQDTKHISSVDEMVLHPNYLKIIALGEDAIPFLLRELQQRPDHWLVALNVLTDQDPAQPEDTFREAVQAWIAWGRQEGHIE